jgi:hypothetical protein
MIGTCYHDYTGIELTDVSHYAWSSSSLSLPGLEVSSFVLPHSPYHCPLVPSPDCLKIMSPPNCGLEPLKL